jgi:putative endonuclease
VEVRTKRSTAYGTPEESLTQRKQARLVKTAEEYLAQHGRAGSSWRVDLVAITLQPDGPAQITHVESAVEDSSG